MEAEKKQEEVQQQGGEGGASYTYWVRQVRNEDAAPLPVPRKLTPNDILNSNSQPPSLGSLWNTVFLLLLFLHILFKDGIFPFKSMSFFVSTGWNLGGEEP